MSTQHSYAILSPFATVCSLAFILFHSISHDNLQSVRFVASRSLADFDFTQRKSHIHRPKHSHHNNNNNLIKNSSLTLISLSLLFLYPFQINQKNIRRSNSNKQNLFSSKFSSKVLFQSSLPMRSFSLINLMIPPVVLPRNTRDSLEWHTGRVAHDSPHPSFVSTQSRSTIGEWCLCSFCQSPWVDPWDYVPLSLRQSPACSWTLPCFCVVRFFSLDGEKKGLQSSRACIPPPKIKKKNQTK